MHQFQRQLEDYIAYFERLNGRSVRLLEKMAAPEIRYMDPFHDVRGIEAMENILKTLFDRKLERPGLKIVNAGWGRDGYTAFLRWDFSFMPRGKREEWLVEGVSEIVFGPDGKVVQHHNHWDSGSQVMAHLPFLNYVWAWVSRKIVA